MLAQNQDNVPEWSDMSINGLMFLWASNGCKSNYHNVHDYDGPCRSMEDGHWLSLHTVQSKKSKNKQLNYIIEFLIITFQSNTKSDMKLKSIYKVVYKQSARQNILLFLIFHISFNIIICNKFPRQENSSFILWNWHAYLLESQSNS